MKKILAISGSPRVSGNSVKMLEAFLEGSGENGQGAEVIRAHELKISACTGCLRCNVLKRCSLTEDDFGWLSRKILEADILVFATPVYFHHVTAPLKGILDRFRSFIHVRITETGLIHTPHHIWNKDFVLLLTMGSPDPAEAEPVVDLFRFMTEMLGPGNRLHVIRATRVAVSSQLTKTESELEQLYPRLGLPVHLAGPDYQANQAVLTECTNLGKGIVSSE